MRTNEQVIKTIDACFVTNLLFPISMRSFIHKFKLLHTFLSATDCIYISLNNWKALDHTISPNKINLAYDESHMSFLCSVDFSVVMLTCMSVVKFKKNFNVNLFLVLCTTLRKLLEIRMLSVCFLLNEPLNYSMTRILFSPSCSILNI